jgi:hypothetical protein
MRRNPDEAAARKTPLATRLTQVRRMVERVEAERVQYEDVGLSRLAQEKAREKRYWQFVQAVLELQPWMGQTPNRHTIH